MIYTYEELSIQQDFQRGCTVGLKLLMQCCDGENE
jgi:hypothetical protein